ncbi:ATP-binding protein [Longimicrobium sp.]|jgi:uncharacterized protein YPO0396|uniref:ATP-binding protein n=1 Tax=Longimicrobium sp. TaxID=2029185 RepID=UPI0032C241A4
MRRLEEIRLVNWHSFGDETIRVEGDVLLTGENGTGKSTILDAVQYALVADLSLVRFNQAANETGRRDLVGYIRGKEKLRDARRPDEVRFRRAASTSHVMLRFGDDADPSHSFLCGIVMEVSEGDPMPVRHHLYGLAGRSCECLRSLRMGTRSPHASFATRCASSGPWFTPT